MIRPFTCLCMLMAAGSGLYLYQTKHRAQLLDQQIARTYKQIDVTRDRIASLKAEWALLNEPDRLKDLAQQHTTLKTLAPTQFVAQADLTGHLSAPIFPTPIAPILALPAIAADEPAVAAPTMPVAAARPAARVLASADKPAPDKPAIDKPATDRPASDKPVAHVAPRPPAPPIAVASALPPPSPSPPRPAPAATVTPPAPRILAPVMNVSAGAVPVPNPIGESVARAARLSAATPVSTTAYARPAIVAPPAYAAPAYATPAYPAPNYAAPAAIQAYPGQVGSALGSAAHAALPPPVPFAAAQGR